MTRIGKHSTGLIGAVVLALVFAACSSETAEENVETTTTLTDTTTTAIVTATTAAETTTTAVETTREAVLLENYAAASNAGDIARAMRVFAPDPVVRRHPFSAGDYLDRSSELRALEEVVAQVRGSGKGLEFLDIVVADGTGVTTPDVTFGWRFLYGADGSESGGEAGCVGGKDGKAFISNGMITEISFGFDDPSKCDL